MGIARGYPFILFFIFFILSSSLFFFSSSSKSTNEREVSQTALDVLEQVEHGDIILINSQDTFSKIVRSFDQCEVSSFKLVVNLGGKKALLVSDADHLNDNTQGLRLIPMKEYFSQYDTLRFQVLRPFKLEMENLNSINQFLGRLDPNDPISYDFGFFKNTQDKLTCEKVVYTVFPYSFSKKNFNRFFTWGFAPCDFQKNQFQPVTEWVNYFNK